MAATARAKPRHAAPPPPQKTPPARSSRLWLCAYFPDLAMETAGLDRTQAIALLEYSRGQPFISALSKPARQLGVEIGMSPAAALALCPPLLLQARDLADERQALHTLADAALNFSPWVSLAPPSCLLLEVSTCLNLFGGSKNLQRRLRQSLQALHHRALIALAPSPAAATLLARLERELIVTQAETLRSLLGSVSITALDLDDRQLQRLTRTGVSCLSDLWRLPRDGLARRFGQSLLQRLDALAGDDKRVLRQFHRPPRFHAHRDMPTELDKLPLFFTAIEQLVDELMAFLLERDAAVAGVTLHLHHYRLASSVIELTFRQGSRNARQCCQLLHDKLERTPLPAPVLAISLESSGILPFQADCLSLFDEAPDSDLHGWQEILEQLQTRLGQQALQTLGTCPEHRPERAATSQAHTRSELTAVSRPLWLLANPKALDYTELRLLTTAERIESGWWDSAGIRRDYHVARDRRGRKLWVFRDLNPKGGWYLHGLFG